MLIHTNQEQNRLIDKGIVNTVIRFDRGFGRDLGKGKTAKMQIIVVGSDSSTAFIILNLLSRGVIKNYPEAKSRPCWGAVIRLGG